MTQEQQERLDFLYYLKEDMRAKIERMEKVLKFMPYTIVCFSLPVLVFFDGYLAFAVFLTITILFVGAMNLMLHYIDHLNKTLDSSNKSYFDYLAKISKHNKTKDY